MTPDEMETAAASFSERVQHVGTGPALEEIVDKAAERAWEAAAREFDRRPGTWTHREVASLLRSLRGLH